MNRSTGLDNQGVTSGDTPADSQTAVTWLHDLSQVVNAWPRLSAPLKAAILSIVNTLATANAELTEADLRRPFQRKVGERRKDKSFTDGANSGPPIARAMFSFHDHAVNDDEIRPPGTPAGVPLQRPTRPCHRFSWRMMRTPYVGRSPPRWLAPATTLMPPTWRPRLSGASGQTLRPADYRSRVDKLSSPLLPHSLTAAIVTK